DTMIRAIARQAEAERERRAKVIHAEGELQASHKLAEAAQILERAPQALQLRYLETLTVIAADKNSTIVFPLPLDIIGPLLQAFLAEKPFIGCAGQLIDDEVRVTIAAQACLLLLNRRHPRYFPGLRQILVYPGAFAVDRVQTDGAVVQDQRQALSGESWSQGQVILSWADALEGAAVVDDGRNVVIHE